MTQMPLPINNIRPEEFFPVTAEHAAELQEKLAAPPVQHKTHEEMQQELDMLLSGHAEAEQQRVHKYLDNFLRLASIVENDPEHEFAEVWFSVKRNEPESREVLRDVQVLINTLGFVPRPDDNPDVLNYKSYSFPRMEIGEIYDQKNDQIIVMVAAIAERRSGADERRASERQDSTDRRHTDGER